MNLVLYKLIVGLWKTIQNFTHLGKSPADREGTEVISSLLIQKIIRPSTEMPAADTSKGVSSQGIAEMMWDREYLLGKNHFFECWHLHAISTSNKVDKLIWSKPAGNTKAPTTQLLSSCQLSAVWLPLHFLMETNCQWERKKENENTNWGCFTQ